MAWPDSGLNEVVKTVGATARNHSTITAWEADTDDNCTAGWGEGDYAAACSPVGDCYDDADFSETVTLTGATTEITHFRTLTAHAGNRHDGTDGDGVRLAGVIAFGNYEDYGVVEWLIQYDTTTTANIAISYSHAGTSVMVRNCVIAASSGYLVSTSDGGLSRTIYLRNCMFLQTSAAYNAFYIDSTDTVYAQNCTLYAPSRAGFRYCACTNCISITGLSAFDNCTGSNNISGDATDAGVDTINNVAAADIFTNTGSGTEDLHLKSGTTDAAGAGSDLSASFTDDIDDDTRSDWDIGADEYVAAGGGLAVAVVALLIQRQNKRKNSLIGR